MANRLLRPGADGPVRDSMTLLAPQYVGFQPILGRFERHGPTFAVFRRSDMERLRSELIPGEAEAEIDLDGGKEKVRCVVSRVHKCCSLLDLHQPRIASRLSEDRF